LEHFLIVLFNHVLLSARVVWPIALWSSSNQIQAASEVQTIYRPSLFQTRPIDFEKLTIPRGNALKNLGIRDQWSDRLAQNEGNCDD
jgi:hypothetical protein